MTPTPLQRVLSAFRRRRVRALLMGGQACIVYGGAEFSRDVDFAIAVDPANLVRLRIALSDLRAVPIFFPPLSAEVLVRGHACHFRCTAAGMSRYRIDVMGRMRGAGSFSRLWRRRNVLRLPGAGAVPVVSLIDLVRIKKTRRPKDWLMIQRVVDEDIVRCGWEARTRQILFWLRECRSPRLLAELVRRNLPLARRIARSRPSLRAAIRNDLRAVEKYLQREQEDERRLDDRYWKPRLEELERWRLARGRKSDSAQDNGDQHGGPKKHKT